MSDRILDLPISPDVARSLQLGDMVYLRGDAVVTAGFPTHQRLYACIENATPPPVDFAGRAFLHLGVMSEEHDGTLEALYVNPTTSTRFNAFMPKIISALGLTIVAGKGGLDESSVAAMRDTGCVYLSMIGGGAPLLTEGIAGVVETGWDDLIAQFRLSRIRLDMFGPLTVAIDAHGNSRYAELSQAARAKLPEIMEMLADRRKGTMGSSKG